MIQFHRFWRTLCVEHCGRVDSEPFYARLKKSCDTSGDFSTRVQIFSMDWYASCNSFPEVSERMTVVPTTSALFTMKLRVVARPE